MYQPLADLLRPTTLDEVFGQEHILGEGAVLRRLIDSGNMEKGFKWGVNRMGQPDIQDNFLQTNYPYEIDHLRSDTA